MGNRIARYIVGNARAPNAQQDSDQPITKFSFSTIGLTHGRVVDVYDGDTCTIAFRCPVMKYGCGVCRYYTSTVVTHRVRMLGYDSPEMKPRVTDKTGRKRTEVERDKERADAVDMRQLLSGLAMGKIVRIEINEKPPIDNFGRMLARLYISCDGREVCVNEKMMEDPRNIPFDAKADRVAQRDALATNA